MQKKPLLIFRHPPEPEEGGAGSGDDEQNAGYRFGEQLVYEFPAKFLIQNCNMFSRQFLMMKQRHSKKS